MLVLIICTEGQNSEPAFIRQLSRCVLGQVHPNIELVEVPLQGNHGHTDRIFSEANNRINNLRMDDNSILSLAFGDTDATIEKAIICDYDKMEQHGIAENNFRNNAADYGYQLILNRPNFEFFVLALVTTMKYATTIKPSEYEKEINIAIDRLNLKNRHEKGFTDAMSIPHYSKRQYSAEQFFSSLLEYNGNELLTTFCRSAPDLGTTHYSQMGELLTEIQTFYNATNESFSNSEEVNGCQD